MREIGHFIGGKAVKGSSGRFGDVYQPMTGEVTGKVALASKAEVRAAVDNAKAAQPAWAATNPQRRARVLFKFLDLVHRDYDRLAELLAREHGKVVADASLREPTGDEMKREKELLDTAKSADLGTEDGRLVLDFNFAYQPSCSYDPVWSCPLAPRENWLTAEVRAGERSPS